MRGVLIVVAGVLAMGMGSLSLADCGQEGCKHVATTQPAADGKKFVCPMKCAGSASDKPGKCPKCGMKLEEQKNPATKPDHAKHKH